MHCGRKDAGTNGHAMRQRINLADALAMFDDPFEAA